VKRIEKVRLYPSAPQDQALRFMLDVTRQLSNAALQERKDAYRLRGVPVTFKMQYAELTALRKPESRLDRRLAAVYRETEDAPASLGACHAAATPRFKHAAIGAAAD
jgi:hypothetical protein